MKQSNSIFHYLCINHLWEDCVISSYYITEQWKLLHLSQKMASLMHFYFYLCVVILFVRVVSPWREHQVELDQVDCCIHVVL